MMLFQIIKHDNKHFTAMCSHQVLEITTEHFNAVQTQKQFIATRCSHKIIFLYVGSFRHWESKTRNLISSNSSSKRWHRNRFNSLLHWKDAKTVTGKVSQLSIKIPFSIIPKFNCISLLQSQHSWVWKWDILLITK
jgi:hypothetical protein